MLGLPVAWYIVCQTPERRRVLLFLVTLPFWINTLIRTYCWILILRDEGLANKRAARCWASSTMPLPLLYNDGAILLGLSTPSCPSWCCRSIRRWSGSIRD